MSRAATRNTQPRPISVVVSSTLLEAEVFSALRRAQREITDAFHAELSLIAPDRGLSEELARVLDAGSVCGADYWHLATALYVAPDSSEPTFLTLDHSQRTVANALGFQM